MTSIGSSAFEGCIGLAGIEIPDGVTSIGEFAFFGCTSLESVSIPNSVTSIGKFAFDGCEHLAIVHYLGTDVDWESVSVGNENDKFNELMNGGYGHFCSVRNDDGQTHTWSCPVCEGYEKTETHNFSNGKCVCGEKKTPTAADFVFAPPADTYYTANNKEATVEVKDGITGVGEITIKYYKNGVEAIPNQVGSYTVQILVSEGENYKSAAISLSFMLSNTFNAF